MHLMASVSFASKSEFFSMRFLSALVCLTSSLALASMARRSQYAKPKTAITILPKTPARMARKVNISSNLLSTCSNLLSISPIFTFSSISMSLSFWVNPSAASAGTAEQIITNRKLPRIAFFTIMLVIMCMVL